jgi:hypothetical protein
MLSAPTSTPPAASSRSIRVASRVAGARSRLVLDRERHAGERAERLAPGTGRVDRARPGAGALGNHRREGIERAVARGDASERRLDDLGGRGAAGRNGAGDLAGRSPVERARPRVQ